MASIPAAELQALMAMDDYDRMLGVDRISRQYGVSAKQVEAQVRTMQAGGTPADIPAEEPMFMPSKSDPGAGAEPPQGGPTYLPDADDYRLQYDPSEEGVTHQAQVNQAIVCPHCSAPLGIPAVRPIKINCPNCMQEATFHS